MLAHELRHVVEQYVLEFRNTIMTVESSLNYDFKHNNIFELDTNSEVYKILKDIIYYMSLEEQRARIQAVWNVCQDAILNNAYRSQLTAAYYRTLSLMYRNDMVPGDDNFRMEIISALRSNPLKYVHSLAGFRRTVNELALIKRPETYKILLVLGYFLEKHGYIKSGNDALVKKFFSKDVVMMKLEEPFSEVDRNFYEVVMKVVQMNYRRYENIVYNVIGMNIEHIFQYKNPDNNTVVKFSRLAADSDLKLKDYEVGLINEAFNLYADAKNRWLNNVSNV